MFSLVTKSTSTIYIEKFRASECWKLLIFIGESISSEYDQANIQIGPLNSKTFCSIICTICTYKYVLNGEKNKEKEEERRKVQLRMELLLSLGLYHLTLLEGLNHLLNMFCMNICKKCCHVQCLIFSVWSLDYMLPYCLTLNLTLAKSPV